MSALALGIAGTLGAVSVAGGTGFSGGGSGGGLDGAGRVLDFRRRGAPPRRRRRNPLLALARPLGVALAAVALPLALAGWLFTSPRFQLRHVVVVPAAVAPAAAAAPASAAARKTQAALAPPPSRPAVATALAAGTVPAPPSMAPVAGASPAGSMATAPEARPVLAAPPALMAPLDAAASPPPAAQLAPATFAARLAVVARAAAVSLAALLSAAVRETRAALASSPAGSASPAPPSAAAPIRAPVVVRATPPPMPGRVPAAWVQQALAPLLGRNLLRLPLAEVRQRLATNPWIAAVDVAKQLPDGLRVSVAERRPAVLLRSGEALLYADAAGRQIAPVGSPAEAEAARRQELLVVTLPPPFAGKGPAPAPPPGGDGAPAAATAPGEGEREIAGALLLAARLRELRPAWTKALSRIDVVDEDDYQLHVSGLPCPLLVRGSHLAGNLERFEQLLPDLRRRYPALASVDLRFSRRIVVQPAAVPAIQPATTPAVRPAAAAARPPAPPAPRAATGGPAGETGHQAPGNP
jgi:cell division septal protein FtsQ